MVLNQVLSVLLPTLAGCLWGFSEIILLVGSKEKELPYIVAILFFRSIFQVLIIVPVTLIKLHTILPDDNGAIYLALRSVSEAIGCICVYMSLGYISPFKETLVSSAKPFLVMIVSYFWLRERIGIISAVCLAFVTVGLVLAFDPVYAAEHGGGFKGTQDMYIGYGLVSISNIASTIYICSCRRLQSTDVLVILCWMSACSVLGSGILSIWMVDWTSDDVLQLLEDTLGWSFLVALLILTSEGLLTYTLRIYPATNAAIYLNSQIPTTLVFQWLLLGKVPSLVVIIGAIIISLCITVDALRDVIWPGIQKCWNGLGAENETTGLL